MLVLLNLSAKNVAFYAPFLGKIWFEDFVPCKTIDKLVQPQWLKSVSGHIAGGSINVQMSLEIQQEAQVVFTKRIKVQPWRQRQQLSLKTWVS